MPRTSPILLCAATLLLALPVPALAKGPLAEPDEGPDPRGLTISGSGVARVTAPERLNESSIEHAVEAARPKALANAMAEARTRATALAGAAGLTLGEVRVVTQVEPELGYFGFAEPPQYCRRRCTAPSFTGVTVRVTFATQQTDAAVPAGRAIVASYSAIGAVSPLRRRSSASIRNAIVRARVAAGTDALTGAREEAQVTATAASMTPGALFSIAEVRRPYDEIVQGSFGPGRFCGVTRRRITRRDPATGRRTVVRTVRERRCYFSRRVSVGLRLTYLPG